MNRSAEVRAWLAANPGWHFMGDICDAMGVSGRERKLTQQTVSRCAGTGHLVSAGSRASMRYTLGPTPRQYRMKEQGNAN